MVRVVSLQTLQRGTARIYLLMGTERRLGNVRSHVSFQGEQTRYAQAELSRS